MCSYRQRGTKHCIDFLVFQLFSVKINAYCYSISHNSRNKRELDKRCDWGLKIMSSITTIFTINTSHCWIILVVLKVKQH